MKRSSRLLLALALPLVAACTTATLASHHQTAMQQTTASQSVAGKSMTTADGLTISDVKIGAGTPAKSGDTVAVSYVGSLTNGTVFDASANHGGSFSFPLGAGQVIKGWDEGVAGMRVGGERKFTIPPALGYGANAVGDAIPANSTLIFTVKLLKIGA